MKTIKILFLTVYLVASSSLIIAQNITISGRVFDESQNVIESATIRLLTNDSAFISGTTTNSSGNFSFTNLPVGSYQIYISNVGYIPLRFSFRDLLSSVKLREIILQKEIVALDEVVVEAQRETTLADRSIIIPSVAEKENSQDAYDLLFKMGLRNIQFDLASRSMSSLNNGSLQIRINGVLREITDLTTIQPSDIKSVEYIDHPGVRYGDGVSAVLDIIVRQRQAGVQGGISTQNRVTSLSGNNSAYIRLTQGESMFSLKGGIVYNTNKEAYSNQHKQLIYPSDVLSLQMEGIPTDNKSQRENLQMEYNHLFHDHTLNVSLSYIRKYRPDQSVDYEAFVNRNSVFKENTLKNDEEHNLALDIYWNWMISKKDNLLFNVTGTDIFTDYKRSYRQVALDSAYLSQFSAYTVDGDHKSVIGELIYERTLSDEMRLTVGARAYLSHTDNEYSGSTGDINPILKERSFYTYAELSGKIAELYYSIGGGLSIEKVEENDAGKTYTFFRPSISLSYPIVKELKMQYDLRINPNKPNLDMLTGIRQQLTEYEVMQGNPSLHPYQAYMNQLALNYSHKLTSLSLTGYLQYNNHPIAANPVVYDETEDVFIYSNANQKSFYHAQFTFYIQQRFLKKKLSFSGYVVLNRHINQGNVVTTTNTSYLYRIDASYDEKRWGINASYSSPIEFLAAETLYTTNQNFQIATYYKIKKLRIGVGASNLFMNKAYSSKSVLDSEVLKNSQKRFVQSNNNLVYVTLSWSFNKGKNLSFKKLLNNQDNASGVVK